MKAPRNNPSLCTQQCLGGLGVDAPLDQRWIQCAIQSERDDLSLRAHPPIRATGHREGFELDAQLGDPLADRAFNCDEAGLSGETCELGAVVGQGEAIRWSVHRGCDHLASPATIPNFMATDKRSGIADDATDYEDIPEPAAPAASAPPPLRKARPRGASGIASDADLFEDLLEESTDGVHSLDSDWLYQVDGHVFGPVKPKELLEMLYRGEITGESPVSSDEGDFRPLRHFAVLRSHLPKVESHHRELEAAKAKDRVEGKARLKKRFGWAGAALVAALIGSIGIAYWVRSSRVADAEADKQAQEAALNQQLDDLAASVSIEPPLMAVVQEPEVRKRGKRSRRRSKQAVARFSGGPAKTGDLTKPEIMKGVGKAFGGLKRCIVKQLQRDKDTVPEQIVLTFSVNNEGRAQNVSLTDRFLRRSPLKACVAAKLARVRWRVYKGEVQNIEYPITIGRH